MSRIARTIFLCWISGSAGIGVVCALGLEGDGAGKVTRPKPPPAASSPPVLSLEDPIFNWGKAFRGEELEHTFVIRNQGGMPLVIESFKPNCGCMSPPKKGKYKSTLQSGEKTSIVLRVSTSSLSPGDIKNKYTEVITNALRGDNKLYVQGELVRALTLEPTLPKVTVIKGGTDPASGSTTFGMRTGIDTDVEVLSLTASKALLAADLREIKKGKHYEVSLSPSLTDTRTAFQSEDLVLKTKIDGKVVLLTISIPVVLKDRIEVSPSKSVYFPRKDTQSGTATRTLTIESIGGPQHSFQISGVKSIKQLFTVTVEPVEEGKRYRLQIRLEKAPPAGKRKLQDTIEVTTNDPLLPVLKIPALARF
jgi:hypothetical protein